MLMLGQPLLTASLSWECMAQGGAAPGPRGRQQPGGRRAPARRAGARAARAGGREGRAGAAGARRLGAAGRALRRRARAGGGQAAAAGREQPPQGHPGGVEPPERQVPSPPGCMHPLVHKAARSSCWRRDRLIRQWASRLINQGMAARVGSHCGVQAGGEAEQDASAP